MSVFEKLIEKWNKKDEDTFHFRVSIAKSTLRIVAGLALMVNAIPFAGLAFVVAEVLGIVEEL